MNTYVEQMILAASPMELVRLMYGQAIVAVKDARGHLSRKQVLERSKAVMRAYGILSELLTSLREEEAPEMTIRLRNLYLYMQGLLLKANCEQVDEPLAEALGLLTTLADAWKRVPDINWQESAANAA